MWLQHANDLPTCGADGACYPLTVVRYPSQTTAMKLLNETDALTEIHDLLGAADTARFAVAFWGEGATHRLGLNRSGLTLRILCNLDSGACNPTELRLLRALPGVTLKSHPALHAKVYWTAQGVVLGSSNALANGLGLEGDTAGGWAEANVRIDDSKFLADIASWFETLFAAGYDIEDADLDLAEQVWKARRRRVPTGKRLSDRLFAVYKQAPGHPAWRQVKLAYCHDELAPDEEQHLEELRSTGELGSDVSAYSQWNDRILPDDWVIAFDLASRVPQRHCVWRALPGKAGRPGLRLVVKAPDLQFEAFGQLILTKADATDLAAIAPAVLASHSDDGGRNALIDLATAMAFLP